MSARSHPRWIVVTLATALVLPGAGASSAESRSSNPDGIFELNRALAYAALPQERCGGGSDLPALGDCLTPDEFVGSGTESIAGSEAVSAETFPGSGDKANGVEFELVPRFAIQTPRWYAALSPMSGDTFVRVHGFGDVAADDADGFDVWNRPATKIGRAHV